MPKFDFTKILEFCEERELKCSLNINYNSYMGMDIEAPSFDIYIEENSFQYMIFTFNRRDKKDTEECLIDLIQEFKESCEREEELSNLFSQCHSRCIELRKPQCGFKNPPIEIPIEIKNDN